MKLTSLIASMAVVGAIAAFDVPAQTAIFNSTAAFADTMTSTTASLTGSQKIANLMQHKGQKGSGDELRSYFLGDLEPVGVQPGGAGMVVNLYNKANDVTIAYCSTYDVVVAVKKGRITQFASAEVK